MLLCLLTDNLNLDIDLDQALAERIDFDQARVDCLVELSKFGHQTNVTLVDILEWVGAADTARNGSHGSNNSAEAVD